LNTQDSIYNLILQRAKNGQKSIAVLIDPDKQTEDELIDLVQLNEKLPFDYYFIGGSLLYTSRFENTVKVIKEHSKKPCIIFPGSFEQVSNHADALLLLSLISGRNPEYLIGNHVLAAPKLKKSNIEVISTGYLLIESGKLTTATYISHTLPIPSNKPEIAATTAYAGYLIGMKIMYLDGGSGAEFPVPQSIIKAVKNEVPTPLIVGGGIKTVNDIKNTFNAGADIVVIGTALEKNPDLLKKLTEYNSLKYA
jgi:putative glycerol-1-phosphate prenyltransferase